jgi:hypothetical protein
MRLTGAILLLGGIGHTGGVARLYLTQGVPDANRVLLDLWIAEAQILGGLLYLAAWRARQKGAAWQTPAVFGALTIIGFAAPMLPVLVVRAPAIFSVPAILYLTASLIILGGSSRRPLARADRPTAPTSGANR